MCTDDTVYSVTIVTNPSKGPFNFEQTVQFSCLVEPTPPISGILWKGSLVDLLTTAKVSIELTTI